MESTPLTSQTAPHLIVLGNEKGGSGKTTSSMHIITSLLSLGFKVGTIDLDSRQRSLTRYIENRRQHQLRSGARLAMPQHVVVNRSPFSMLEEAEEDERICLMEAIRHLSTDNDFLVIDCPGSDQYMARLAHSLADTIVTPINDSFIDLDVIASIHPETHEMIKPSIYSEMLWEQKLSKAKKNGASIDWIVMRNRLSNLDARNKRAIHDATIQLAKRIGFRLAPGFSERVIFRELFLQGLTVIDVMQQDLGISVSMSHVAAREEVRQLMRCLSIPRVDEAMQRQLNEDRQSKMVGNTSPTDAKTTVATAAAGTSQAAAMTQASVNTQSASAQSIPTATATPVAPSASMTAPTISPAAEIAAMRIAEHA